MSRLIYTLVVFGALLAASVRDWIVGVVRARSLRPRAI
jgi:hypothetical protein